MKLKPNKRLLLIFSYLLVGFLVVVAVKAFTGPTQNPPGGNPAWPKVNTVVGTSDIAINTSTWTDMTNMTYTDTFAAGNVLISFNAEMWFPNDDTGAFRIVLDDNTILNTQLYKPEGDTSMAMPISLQYVTNLSAASHTIKIQWKSGGSSDTITQYGTLYSRTLIVMRGFN